MQPRGRGQPDHFQESPRKVALVRKAAEDRDLRKTFIRVVRQQSLRTAHAQMLGGIVWGWGMAAMEQSAFEPTLGRFLSKNLAGVAIPVNADIPSDITIHFVDEIDDKASPIGGKGVGELGATGVAAAIANAVFQATGKRIRDLPITPEKLIA